MDLPISTTDSLCVLSSTRPVVLSARHVRINAEAIDEIADSIATLAPPAPAWGDDFHFRDGTSRTAAWVFVLDALNFCFWTTDPAHRWRVAYEGILHDGYWALVAALRRALDEGYPLDNAAFLRDLDLHTVEHLLRPTDPSDPPIPLLEDRWRNLTELGRGLLAIQSQRGNADGELPVETLLRLAGGSAVQLIELVIHWFPSFDDTVEWEGAEVRFLKRAQILIADLSAAFSGERLGAFDDLHVLTAFADYKVPQVLRRLGILEYDEELGGLLDAYTLVPAGSRHQIEIRAATIWAVELIRQSASGLGSSLAAHEIDWALWQEGQSAAAEDRPYHRTLTIYY